jgi:hypothetical protein
MDNTNQDSNYGVLNESNMVNKESKNKHYARMVFITLFLLFLFAGGYVMLSNNEVKKQLQLATGMITAVPEQITAEEEPLLTPAVIQSRTSPWLELKSDNLNYKVGDEVMITLNGYSGGKDIVGYDILIGADSVAWETVSIDSAISDFLTRKFDRGNFQSVTGIKDIKSKDPKVLDNTPVLFLKMKPKISGQLTVSVFKNQGPEQTKFVDADVNVIEPQIGSITVNVAD